MDTDCCSQGIDFRIDCSEESWNGLQELVRTTFVAVAKEYHLATSETLVVTSGWRSLRKAAELMSGFTLEQLEGMYCRHGYPSYIRQIGQKIKEKNCARLSSDEIYTILCEREEGYISWHLQGGALDILAPVGEPQRLKQLLEKHNFKVFDEQNLGISCYHATMQGLPQVMVRA